LDLPSGDVMCCIEKADKANFDLLRSDLRQHQISLL